MEEEILPEEKRARAHVHSLSLRRFNLALFYFEDFFI